MSGEEPAFRVVRGDPTAEELAALVVAFRLLGTSGATEPAAESSHGWAAYWRSVRAPLSPGPGGWRASGRP